jgi:hypothetical protein
VKSKEQQLIRRNKVVQMSNDQLKSLQEMVETELADNKHSEYLIRLFASRENTAAGKTTTADVDDVDKSKPSAIAISSKVHSPSKLDDLKVELKAGVGGMRHPGSIKLLDQIVKKISFGF